jgi:beta-glucuronidase
MLRPVDNGFRERRSLNGLWRFRADAGAEGGRHEWWRRPLPAALEMPVPASYNDVLVDAGLQGHVGDVWYQTATAVPHGWTDQRVVLRFDAATHAATVWVDDVEVAHHQGGYTPFEADISSQATPGRPLRITVRVSNELTWATIPPGVVEVGSDGKKVQRYFHDFFNYAGLHRSVWLCSTPQTHVRDIAVTTRLEEGIGTVGYRLDIAGAAGARIDLLDAGGACVATTEGIAGELHVPDVHPWAPGDGYLYTLGVSLRDRRGDRDRYDLPVGVRTVAVDGDRLLVNDRPLHLTGFGRHEDSAVRGKGHDDALMVHDFSLMRWTGANSFRTSHYPYAEEVMEYADRQGFAVIDEVPAVGLNLRLGQQGVGRGATFSPDTVSGPAQRAHLEAIRELIARDRNHPSVLMWSLANEPDSTDPGARAYFEPLVEEARRLDPSRPLCFANAQLPEGLERDTISDLFDVLCLNRYFGWYVDTGDLGAAERALEQDLRAWADHFAKPIVVTEYGADAVAGLRSVTAGLWTEDYQRDLLATYHRVFDRVGAVVGEHVWNFADFATGASLMRADGNRKGVFTRDRRPKLAAQVLRDRWTAAGH